MNREPTHRVVIVGGGFGGLYAARSLHRAPAQITLIDRRNHHLFQPLLYQVATGALSPANIAAPLRALLRRQKNTRVLMAEVVDVKAPEQRLVMTTEGMITEIPYDTLIVATGSQFNYFGHDEWAKFAPGLKSVEDALAIRSRVLKAFEMAELETDREKQRAHMTFVVVGAGPTGVEMAGALAEVAHHTLRHDFRNIDPVTAQVLLVESQDQILATFPRDLQLKAIESLKNLGVTVRLGVTVTEITPHGATMKTGGQSEQIRSSVVLWTAGVRASPLSLALANSTSLTTDRAGRLSVEPDLTLPGFPNIFVIGDLAVFTHQTGRPLPGLAPVAMQQGRYVAKVIECRLREKTLPGPFHYRDRGNMATIGRAAAVADLGWIHLSGYVAWLAWLFVHLINLVLFANRLLVLTQWAYNYFTRNRAARLITDEAPCVDRS